VAFQTLIDEVNAKGLAVCEVGSRNVSPGATSKRSLFPAASKYVGTDVHMADNVDIAGDAHYLDDLLGNASVDAVFSIAVMEHLSFPWVFAAAVNRVLRPGGLTFHLTHQSWPPHEEPNDFWRFSDNAMRVLFGPEMGYETVYAGMHNRTYLYPEERRESFATLPLAVAYSHVFVLARKVRTIDPDAVRWPAAKEATGKLASRYPPPR
jgi:SAM-dependent methyltransferase